MRNRIDRLAVLLVLAGLWGCGGTSAPESLAPPAPVPPPPAQGERQLTIVGWQQFSVAPAAPAILQVRYTEGARALAQEQINFAFASDGRDAQLEALSSATNSDGLAQVTLRAGLLAGPLTVEARSPDGARVEWQVAVEPGASAPPLGPPQLAGAYAVSSTFKIETPLEGSNTGDVLSLLNEMTNDPDDPGTFVVDRVLDKVDSETFSAVAGYLRPALDAEVTKALLAVAPGRVEALKRLARDISTISRRFEISSELVVQQPGHSPKVTHVLKRISWQLEGKQASYDFARLGLGEPTADGLALSPLAADQAGLVRHQLQRHTFDLKLGSFMLVVLNELLIPGIDSSASDMGSLLGNWLRCEDLGPLISKRVKVGGDSLWSAACSAATSLLATTLESRLTDASNDKTALTIEGEVRLADQTGDGLVDLLGEGIWRGSFSFADAEAEVLPADNTFSGSRVR